jgi:hypothetical protein
MQGDDRKKFPMFYNQGQVEEVQVQCNDGIKSNKARNLENGSKRVLLSKSDYLFTSWLSRPLTNDFYLGLISLLDKLVYWISL